jgi:hypothetical protein
VTGGSGTAPQIAASGRTSSLSDSTSEDFEQASEQPDSASLHRPAPARQPRKIPRGNNELAAFVNLQSESQLRDRWRHFAPIPVLDRRAEPMSAKHLLIFPIYLIPIAAFFVIALHVLHRNFPTVDAPRAALDFTNIFALTPGFIMLLALQYGMLWLSTKLFNPLPDPGGGNGRAGGVPS